MAATATVDFEVTGTSLDELEQRANTTAAELAGDRTHTVEIDHTYGTWNFSAKTQPTTPPSFSAHVTVRIDAPPDTFVDRNTNERAMML